MTTVEEGRGTPEELAIRINRLQSEGKTIRQLVAREMPVNPTKPRLLVWTLVVVQET